MAVRAAIVHGPAPPNFTLKPLRPGFGPGLKPLGRTEPARRHAGCRSRVAVQRYTRQPACRSGFGTWALAAQLSVCAVRRTRSSTREREPGGATSLLASRMAVAAKPLAKAELNGLYEVASTSLSASSTCAAIGGAEVAAVARIRVRQFSRANSRER
jgi:hypothetical protein